MSYIVNKTDGNIAAVVDDGTLNTTTSLDLLGRGYNDYGDVVAQNLVALMENFSSPLAPRNPILGQLWYKKDDGKLRIFDGNKFTTVNNVSVASATSPINPAIGDLWFDSSKKQLFFYRSPNWQLVGPAYNSSQSRSELVVEDFNDTAGVPHSVVVIYSLNKPAIVINNGVTFTTTIPGFETVYTGLNVASQYLVANSVINGTTIFSMQAGGLTALADATYMHANSNTSTIGTLHVLNNGGISIGPSNDISISTLVASPYTVGSSLSVNTNKTFAISGFGGGSIFFDNASPDITIPNIDGNFNVNGLMFANQDLYVAGDITLGEGHTGGGAYINSQDQTLTFYINGSNPIISANDTGILLNAETTVNNNVNVNFGNISVTSGQVSLREFFPPTGPFPSGYYSPAWPTSTSHAVTKQYADSLVQQNTMPIGSIMMWYGAVNAVPAGWRICDGTGGTPDLRDKFIMGAGNTAVGGTTGGVNTMSVSSSPGGGHVHLGTTDEGGVHNHGGNTDGHALLASELPSHSHNVDQLFGQQDDAGTAAIDRNGDSFQSYNQWGNDHDGDTGNPVYFLTTTPGTLVHANSQSLNVSPIFLSLSHTSHRPPFGSL